MNNDKINIQRISNVDSQDLFFFIDENNEIQEVKVIYNWDKQGYENEAEVVCVCGDLALSFPLARSVVQRVQTKEFDSLLNELAEDLSVAISQAKHGVSPLAMFTRIRDYEISDDMYLHKRYCHIQGLVVGKNGVFYLLVNGVPAVRMEVSYPTSEVCHYHVKFKDRELDFDFDRFSRFEESEGQIIKVVRNIYYGLPDDCQDL